MKERILMGIIGLLIILILSWAVSAVASSFNQTMPSATAFTPDYKTINAEESQSSKVDIVKGRESARGISGLPEAKTNH